MTLSPRPTAPQAPARRPLRIRHALALRCPTSPGKTTVALNRSTSRALMNESTLLQDNQDNRVTGTP
ncbi:hypothetical protein [Nocardiopsis valliformis]|uniref:hypothetical protein n=1 Tax=Nocardiopsis valliformis TaxID=239974 RepID=UPI000346609C|nr:hypothetical protein [Nocardiopsis valliformis]